MAKTDEYNGYIFGDWEVLSRVDSKKVRCRCTICGNEKDIAIYSLEHGDTKRCNAHKSEIKIGTKFGDWEVLGKSKEPGKLICRCSCNTVKNVSKARLLEGRTKSCGHGNSKKLIDLTNKEINSMKVISYAGNRKWNCKCTICGSERVISGNRLRNYPNTITCTHCNNTEHEDLTGQQFGEWTVLEYVGNGKYKCECSCTNIRIVSTYALKSGESKSCGHNTTAYIDIINQKFGKLTVLSRCDSKSRYYKCKCECNNIVIKHKYYIMHNKNASCGCDILERTLKSRLDKYGEICPQKKDNPREQWQIDTLINKEKLYNYIISFTEKPSIQLLAYKLGVNESNIGKRIHKYELDDYVDIHSNVSEKEKELRRYIENIYDAEIIYNSKNIINPYELDIYIPEKKLAIEFNGNYWHSDIYKDEKYHQNKTLACAKQGIHLIHIFEYEWDDIIQRNIILDYIRSLLSNNNIKVFARNTVLKEITDIDSEHIFLDENHLQGYTISKIRIGCYYNNEIIAILTLGKPRFNSEYQYEILRYCTKQGYAIVGGLEKMFKYFIKTYNPQSVITYSDISKFTGNSYLKLGFTPIQPNPITEPNYVWASSDSESILKRYQTQKYKLLEAGIGDVNMTEDEIMRSLRYFKIYNSGNIRLEWKM